MKPVFPRINNAIKFTLDYYWGGRIHAHCEKFHKKSPFTSNPDYLDTYYDLVFTCHSQMEEEIYQIINTTNENTQVYVFEELALWLQDVRISSVNESWLLNEIDTYNDKANEKFTKDIEKQELDFINSSQYYREHNTEYQITVPAHGGLFPGHFIPERTKTIKHSKFFCIEKDTEMIDWNNEFRGYYLNLLHQIVSSFQNIVGTLVNRYKEGKILPSASIVIEKQKLLEAEPREEIIESHQKIKTNLTVAQLAMLFNLLQKSYLINQTFDIELMRLIAQNFSSKESENISLNSLRKLFYPDQEADSTLNNKAFWIDKFTKWIDKLKDED
ncbi:MAG: hypothetical protein K2X37_13705 [Chitinophagaceae bacterium]|nr:hypothetical protein [Chitinophagaceae bacterium]